MKLQIEFLDAAEAIMIRVEGRIVGRFAGELRDFVARCRVPMRTIVNLSQVSVIDFMGEEVLCTLSRIGVKLVADTVYAQGVCTRLRLPVMRTRAYAVRNKV